MVETDGGAAYLRNRRYIKASTATARRNVVGASIAAVDKGKKREGVLFKLTVQFKGEVRRFFFIGSKFLSAQN